MGEIYLTPKEVADRLGYNLKSIQRYCKLKAIPAVKIRRSYRIPEKWVIQNTPVIDDLVQADKLEPEIKVNEVQDMPKKKTESGNTEIVTNTPKAKEFIPNPKKRIKKQIKEPELEDDYEPELEDEDEGIDIFKDYKIGEY